MQRDPAGVPPHHLDDQRPVVRLGRRVQPVDRLHRDVDRRVEAERVVGAERSLSIVFGTPTTLTPMLVQLRGHPEGVLAADRDQGVDPEVCRLRLIFSTPPSIANGLVRELPRIVPPRGRRPRTAGTSERLGQRLERAAPAVAEADELVADSPGRPCGRSPG